MENKEFIEYGNRVKEKLETGNFNEMFENIGVVNYMGFDDYSHIIRAIYYFQQNYYNKCLLELEKVVDSDFTNMPELRIFYWNYRIASMARLHKFDEVRDLFWSEDVVMTINGFSYAKYISYKCGFEDEEPGIHRPDELVEPINLQDDFFYAYFYQMLFCDLLNAYSQNNERLLLKSAGIEKRIRNDLKKQIQDIVSAIDKFSNGKYLKCTTEFGEFIKQSKQKITQDKEIDKSKLFEIILETLGNYNWQDVYNWSFLIDSAKELLSEDDLFEFISKYNDYIQVHIAAGNEIVCKKVLSLTYNHKLLGYKIDGQDFALFWQETLEEHNPGFLEEYQIYACKKDIFDALSDSGKWAYKAAMWQYEQYDQNCTGLMDAGLLSLAFMRILELELNIRMIVPLKKLCKNQLENKLKEMKLPETIDEKFSFLICNETKNLMLGPLRHFIENIRDNNIKGAKAIYALLVENILTEYGKDCLDNGTFDTMLSQGVVDKYRNPPAHAKYLSKKEAVTAMHYVESQLPVLFKCF